MLTRTVLWAQEAYALLFDFATLDAFKTSVYKIPVNLAQTHQHKFKIVNLGTKTHFSPNCKNLPDKLGTQQGSTSAMTVLQMVVAHVFQHKL